MSIGCYPRIPPPIACEQQELGMSITVWLAHQEDNLIPEYGESCHRGAVCLLSGYTMYPVSVHSLVCSMNLLASPGQGPSFLIFKHKTIQRTTQK